MNLTRSQQKVYDFLVEHEKKHGKHHPLFIMEITQKMGYSSRGSMHKHLLALVEAGLVQPSNGKRRGWRLEKEHK